MNTSREVVFVAAENGALRGGKVGGIADVVRDLPAALATEGWKATVVTPSYDVLHKLPGAERVVSVEVPFRGVRKTVDLWLVPGDFDTVRNLVIDHELFSKDGAGIIYDDGEPDRPYADDANKFAFFCACVASWIEQSENPPDIVHLHDWHAAFYCLIRNFSASHRRLRNIRTVFTIHNLSYQGTRPLRADESSLDSWFPDLLYDETSLQDPVYLNCVNPMAAAIRLADCISTVSPTYATEVCQPSKPDTGFIGGEGLEELLQAAANSGRLMGVLNGCYYDEGGSTLKWVELVDAMLAQVSKWQQQQPSNEVHVIALTRLRALPRRRPRQVITSVGRLVAQKATLMVAPVRKGRTALHQISENLGDDGLLIILGSGEAKYEQTLLAIVKECSNILFLRGYSENLAEPLYALGDIFLMPSSFEPCGISQMLSMRASQPCVVHGVGGLLDTVEHGITGFVFNGKNLQSQTRAFVKATRRATTMHESEPKAWQQIRKNAGQQRFDWSSAAQQTIARLYETHHEQ